MNTQTVKKHLLRPAEVDRFLGSKRLRLEMVAAGWLRPAVRSGKLTLFDVDDVVFAFIRFLAGETPVTEEAARQLASRLSPHFVMRSHGPLV